jgi:ABC-type uncharacterized transport system involved in gliding motility auxiliary subunit
MNLKSRKSKLLATTAGGLGILLIAILCFNIIASRFYGRLDVTQDKIYSLSDGTKKIIDKVGDDVVVKFYFSRSVKQLPVMIKTYASRVEEVLKEYQARSQQKIIVEVLDPKPDTDDEEWARKYGIQGIPLGNGEQIYFGAVFLQGKREFVIPYFDPRREEFVEYDISEALVQVQTKTKTKVGILSSLGVMGAEAPMMMQMQPNSQPSWIFVEQLRKNFEVVNIPSSTSTIDPAVNVLVVIHPKQLSDATLYGIDQFVMRGGRLVVAVDPFSRVELSQVGAMARQQGQMPQVGSDLKTLFAAWEVEFEGGQIVGDLDGMMQVNAGGVAVAYPYFVTIRNDGFDRKSVITQKLNQMLIAEGGALKLKAGSKFEFAPLLQTSPEAGSADAAFASFIGPAEFAKQLKQGSQKAVLAALLTGEFSSAFKDGPPPASDADKSAPKPDHLAAAKQRNSILIIGDVDFLHDSNSVEQFRFGPQVITRPRNDNLAFLMNAVDYLGGSEDLISIRSRGKLARPFTRVEEIQKAAQLRWQKEEDRLSQRLTEVDKKLNELQGQRADGSRLTLSPEQEREVVRFRQEEAEVRKARREVRKNLREDIEKLGNRLIALNMLVVPFGVGVFGVSVFVRRSRRMKRKDSQ